MEKAEFLLTFYEVLLHTHLGSAEALRAFKSINGFSLVKKPRNFIQCLFQEHFPVLPTLVPPKSFSSGFLKQILFLVITYLVWELFCADHLKFILKMQELPKAITAQKKKDLNPPMLLMLPRGNILNNKKNHR